MKKSNTIMVIFLAALFIGGLVSTAMAAPNTTNVNNKGSLLIFPKIVVIDDDEYGETDTIITIGNDYSQGVDLKCYYLEKRCYDHNAKPKDKDPKVRCDSVDFTLKLTANQPTWWSAKTGKGMVSNSSVSAPPFTYEEGELKCFAIKLANGAATDQQIKFNHLYGNAVILNTEALSWQYPAYAFPVVDAVPHGGAVGAAGQLALNGTTGYYACPAYMIHNFFAEGTKKAKKLTVGKSDIAIALCKEDLRIYSEPVGTDVIFEIWNENESKRTGAKVRVDCWVEKYLSYVTNGRLFKKAGLGTDAGRFRAKSSDPKVPILTVLATEVAFGDYTNTSTTYVDDKFGTVGSHSGINPNGVIYWDPQDIVPESAQ
jgi:hypothetical protein